MTPAARVAAALGVTLADYLELRAERIDRIVRAIGHVVTRHRRAADLATVITPSLRLAARIDPSLSHEGAERPDEFFRRVLNTIAAVAEDGAAPVELEDLAGQLQVSLAAFLSFYRCPVVGAICDGVDEPACVGGEAGS